MSATTEQLRWLAGNDVGISSMTIWWVMTGERPARLMGWSDKPQDDDDLGRCLRLLALFPEWRGRLPEVAAIFPRWGPLVREWDALEAAHRRAGPTSVWILMEALYAHRCACGDYELGRGPAGETHEHRHCAGARLVAELLP